MTILEAFRNRALWVPERSQPVYRIEYGTSSYRKNGLLVRTHDVKTAKEELQQGWEAYTNRMRIPKDCIKEISCVGNQCEGSR
jgi:hypothetical protein